MKKFVVFLNLFLICSFVSISCVNEKGGYENGHEYVDLGLSVKWATCNIGADSAWNGGSYFAWGEVEPRQWGDTKMDKYSVEYEFLTKYCTVAKHGYNGLVDDKIILDAEDDAATINWGGRWRMPTKEEFEELCDNCTFELQTLNGEIGYKVIGKNGNSIFLPMPTWIESESVLEGFMKGSYWSSSLFISSPFYAYQMSLVESEEYSVYLEGMPRHCPTFIRPVCP
jgi:hypothetical protein